MLLVAATMIALSSGALLSANDSRANQRVVGGIVTCSAVRWNGANMVSWMYANTTLARMVLELYFDQPLLPQSYYHVCTPASDYLLQSHSAHFYGDRAFYAKTNIYRAVANRCSTGVSLSAQPQKPRNDTACACRLSQHYAMSALGFLLMRTDERGSVDLVDIDQLNDESHAASVLRKVADYTGRTFSYNASRYARLQLEIGGWRPMTASALQFLAQHETTISACFAREWYVHDNALLYTHFPELQQHRMPGDPLLRRSVSQLPTNVHVLIPTKSPQALSRCVSSLHDRADLSFGSVHFHFGIDWKDNRTRSSVLSTCSTLGVHCTIHEVFSRSNDVSAIVNHMFVTIYDKGYFMRFNDDSEMLTSHWNRKAIDSLRREPVDVGMSCLVDLSNLSLQTHSFVSSVHRDIFGYYFPFHFKNIYEDNWITRVYQGVYSKPCVVRLRHHAKSMRYAALTVPRDVLESAITKAQARIANYMRQHRATTAR